MTSDTETACLYKSFIYTVIAFLCLLSASGSLETYLYLPGIVWILGGSVIAGGWAYEKLCRFDGSDGNTHDCSACGVFGHKLPWILLVGCGLANLVDPTTGWSAFSAYAIAVALFSLTGSFFMMRLNEDKSEH
ncbi:MAG: hypothetical protein ISR45_04230 [Rhodospirillales bacterium]|nr:hypothetical protein [Rhodospirillales bacterium]